MNGYEQRRHNDIEGLGWVHQFGWLRTAELGALMWPGTAGCRTHADRMARSWLERGLVLARELPERSGRALVMATKGVRLLADAGVEAATGKDIGRLLGEKWTPPASWKHDLISAGVLARLHKEGFEVLPEAHIKRYEHALVKIPDGLAIKGNTVIWIECERARKDGRAKSDIAAALALAAAGECKPVLGHRPSDAMVAFLPGGKDERGYQVDHQGKLRNAVARQARKDTTLWWAECSLKGAGVKTVTFTKEVIRSDLAGAILQRLNVGGWRENADGALEANYGHINCIVWEYDHGLWSYQVDGAYANYADNITDAKRRCAEQIAEASQKGACSCGGRVDVASSTKAAWHACRASAANFFAGNSALV